MPCYIVIRVNLYFALLETNTNIYMLNFVHSLYTVYYIHSLLTSSALVKSEFIFSLSKCDLLEDSTFISSLKLFYCYGVPRNNHT
jgi:hypothetical protein